MITQIQGKLVEKNPTQVVVDCNGIGYEINISLFTFSSLSSDENIKLFTHLQVREDAHILYGFFTVLERAVFRLLISVSGIGTVRQDHAFFSYSCRNPACHWNRGCSHYSGY